MKKLVTITGAAILTAAMTGCSFSVGMDANNAAANKPATNAPATNTNAASNANAANKSTDSKPALQSEKRPEGAAKTAKKNAVPANWIYVYDEAKGYGFSMPEGSTGETEKIEGVDIFAATTPAPSEVDVFVLAYKDAKRTKEDLLNDAVEFLESLGQKITPGALKAESGEYAVADATTEHPERGKGKLRILVGTDVTDNYVMIIGTDESKFAANEAIIDQIWGSFEIWSGGAGAE